jgi:hypothetical protein
MSTTVTFPSIAPTSRSFRPPEWPTSDQQSQAGVTSVRLWGSKPSNGSLTLAFTNIRDVSAAQILVAHRQAKGHVLPLLIPPLIFQGMETELEDAFLSIIGEASLTWHFVKGDPPSVETVKRGISSVQVTLNAVLRLT